MALALARNGVRHGVFAPPAVIRNIVQIQVAELGYSYYYPHAPVRVAGVDTLIRHDGRDPWFQQVGLWIQDEAHHVLKDNKWGRATRMFPNARGLGVTATAVRADGKGLGRDADGVFDDIVLGPTMRDLIQQGFLTRYRIFVPPSDLRLVDVPVAAGGDYQNEALRKVVHAAKITGNVVNHYLRLARGKRGITFTVDVESAIEMAEAYRQAGVPAEAISGKTPDQMRMQTLRRFAAGEILQIVNCDIFGEGFDCPALEVVSFARPTLSYGLYCQQFGRVMRPMPDKEYGIVIDHVGNVVAHGLPDAPRQWSLARRERGTRGLRPDDVIPLRICTNCEAAYERILRVCPYCDTPFVPAGRGTVQQVDGHLIELEPRVLAQMRGEIARVDGAPLVPNGLEGPAIGALHRNWRERQEAQRALRAVIALWGGQKDRPADVGAAQAEFFFRFGVDVMTAQTLGAREAEALAERIQRNMT